MSSGRNTKEDVLDVAGDSSPHAGSRSGAGFVRAVSAQARPAEVSPTKAATHDFRSLYEHYFPLVWRWATRLGIPHSALDDVVQEIFLAIFQHVDEFEGRSSLKTWIFGVTIGVTRNFRRRHTSGPVGGSSSELDTLLERAPHPEEIAQQSEALALLQTILDALDDEKREVFVLSELEELTMIEISQIVGVSPNTITSRLRLARQAVQAAWERAAARDNWRLR